MHTNSSQGLRVWRCGIPDRTRRISPHSLSDEPARVRRSSRSLFCGSILHGYHLRGIVISVFGYHGWTRMLARGFLPQHVVPQLERWWPGFVGNRSRNIHRLHERWGLFSVL